MPRNSSLDSQGRAHAARSRSRASRIGGVALIGFAVAMNVPFALLATYFEYPAILREEPLVILERFHAAGPSLLAVWYAYAFVAISFLPIAWSIDKQLGPHRSASPRLAPAVAVLAGAVQSLALLRWVFVVPGLAQRVSDPGVGEAERASIATSFEVLHQFLGVAMGEHMGQALTALWTVLVAWELRRGKRGERMLAGAGVAAAALLWVGLTEGFATVLDFEPGVLALATPVGFVGWSVWLAALGVHFVRAASFVADQPPADGASFQSSA